MVGDLGGLLARLADAGIRCVVIGGIAVAAHAYVRATEDLDIVPDPARDNLDELANLLVSFDARLLRDPDRAISPEIRQQMYRGGNLTVTMPIGDLDIVQRLPGVPSFRDLDADSWEAELAGTRFRVCSLAHLIAMKRARGAPIDLADLEHLQSD
jgi:hypothetical protein